MRRDSVLIIVATVIAVAFFYFRDRKAEPLNIGKNKIQSEANLDLPADKNQVPAVQPIASSENTNTEVVSAATPVSTKDQISRNFVEHLKEIKTCLNIQNAIDYDVIEPTYNNLVVSLLPALGNVVVQMDDWTQVDLESADGTKKRLRTEINYENPNAPVKYVQLYHINDQGMPEMQMLDPEKSRNPSDDYINYLRGGATPKIDERGSRVFFEEGEEIILVEREGLIQSFTLTKGNRTISCTALDAIDSNCQCLH